MESWQWSIDKYMERCLDSNSINFMPCGVVQPQETYGVAVEGSSKRWPQKDGISCRLRKLSSQNVTWMSLLCLCSYHARYGSVETSGSMKEFPWTQTLFSRKQQSKQRPMPSYKSKNQLEIT